MTNKYLLTLEKFAIIPNFYCSDEYFKAADWDVVLAGDYIHVIDTEDGELVLPVINLKYGELLKEKCWVNFPGMGGESFHDYNFIYEPARFLNMKGKEWAVFRKNSRKFPNRAVGVVEYKEIQYGDEVERKESIFVDWVVEADNFSTALETLKYLSKPHKSSGVFLNNRLIGYNIWDENYMFVNFRYCVSDGTPFLNEFLRFKFFTETMANNSKKVNDGGAVDSTSLYKFKKKLNPCLIYELMGE